MKILIVDDNSGDRILLKYNIENHGHKVIEAENGKSGLEKAAVHEPDLIISDVMMPVMDGFHFLRKLKEDDRLKNIPLIFYSSVYTGEKEVSLGLSQGAEAYISKPAKPEKFWDEINRIVKKVKTGKVKRIIIKKDEDQEFLRNYSGIVVAKLEDKIKELQAEIVLRKQKEAALVDSEEKLRLITESAQDAIIMVDTDRNIRFWNSAAKRIFGYSSKEALRKKFFVLFASREISDIYDTDFEQVIKTGSKESVEKVIEVTALNKNGDEFPVEISISAALFENKWHVINIVRDITYRKIAEETLLENERRYRTFFESSSDAMVIFDNDGFFDCNDRVLELFGCSHKADFLNKRLVEFSPLIQPDGQNSEIQEKKYTAEAFQKGSIQFEWTLKKLDGTEFPSDIWLTSIILDGKPVILATVRNIADRKLIEEQMLQSAKMATLGEMATGIAHEINQPLSVIKMGVQLVRRSMENDNLTNEFLQDQVLKFTRNIERAIKIVNHLRLFGRNVSSERIPLNIKIPVANSIEMVENHINGKSIQICLDFVKDVPDVLGEESSLEQVFINILLNAIDALSVNSDGLKKEIIIRVQYDPEKGEVIISFFNNGPQIPRSIINKLFDPFFTTKDPGKGTGLGLSISYGIIKSHEGNISVENTENGPCFKIQLPVVV